MTGNKRILSIILSAALIFAGLVTQVSARQAGTAGIGFSRGGIYYMPYGISGVEGTLDLEFGDHLIRDDIAVQNYTSLNQGGYVVYNQSGGTSGYTLVLGLSSFDRGLEGASLTLFPDDNGLVSGTPGAQNPPVFMNGQGSVTLEADGLSTVVVMEGRKHSQDPDHTALGRWGFNFLGDLQVYSHTILEGRSRAIMTWDLVVADF